MGTGRLYPHLRSRLPLWHAPVRELRIGRWTPRVHRSTPRATRIVRTKASVGPADPPSEARVIVTLEQRSRSLPGSYALAPLDCPPHADDEPDLGFLKSGHYSLRCNSLRKARALGADEALLFDPMAGAISGAMSNFFWKANGRWHTAPIGFSVRNGVWREWWMHQSRATESQLTPEQLPHIQAATLTSSWIGVMPIHRIGDISLAELAPRIARQPRPL